MTGALSVLTSGMIAVSDPAGVAEAAPGDVDEVIAYVVEGTGNGHGRGLSQWGAYGWAVEHGWGWERILDHYYGGTVMGDIDPGSPIRVRLTAGDDDTTVILITGYGSVETAVEAIRAGAFDLLTKPLIDDELELAIDRALAEIDPAPAG